MLPLKESVGLVLYVIVNVIVCFLDMVLGFVVVFLQGQTISATRTMTSGAVAMSNIRLILSILFPTVNLKHALFNIHLRSSETCVSSVNSILGSSYSTNEPWMSMREPGLGIQTVIFFSQMIGWWLIILLIEQSNRICRRKSKESLGDQAKNDTTNWNDSVRDFSEVSKFYLSFVRILMKMFAVNDK